MAAQNAPRGPHENLQIVQQVHPFSHALSSSTERRKTPPSDSKMVQEAPRNPSEASRQVPIVYSFSMRDSRTAKTAGRL